MQEKQKSKGMCPLFIAYSGHEILCKSHINGAKCVAIRYNIKKNMEKQMECFCMEHYKSCEHYLSCKHFEWDDD